MSVSIIIPAYNEEPRIARTLETLIAYARRHERMAEIIVVDDGSSDATAQTAETFGPAVRVLISERNSGKGHALRAGFSASGGEIVVFSDGDLPYGIEGVAACIDALRRTGADAAVGDRTLDASSALVRPPLARRALSFALSVAVRRFCDGFEDTQCGVKAFRRHVVKDIADRLVVDGFAIDIELLRAMLDRNYRIERVPVRMRPSEGTSVRLVRDSVAMARDITRIWWRSQRGEYRR